MAETLSKEQRSSLMARVKSSNTTPERYVRRELWVAGFRYRRKKEATSTDRDEAVWMDELREKLRPFMQIDWSRQSDIWDGNIVIGRDKIRTQGPAVKGAAENMLALLGKADQLQVA